MAIRRLLILAFAIAVSVGLTVAQQKEIKRVPVKPTSPASGQEMYETYCAVCHGKDGKGNGPAASALKAPPSDLTTLAQKNGGKYPSNRVLATIQGDEAIPAHGTKEMPIWGNLFWHMSKGNRAEVQLRVANLNHYIEEMQTK